MAHQPEGSRSKRTQVSKSPTAQPTFGQDKLLDGLCGALRKMVRPVTARRQSLQPSGGVALHVLKGRLPAKIEPLARRKLRPWCRWVHWIAGKHLRPLFVDMCKGANMITGHLDGILGHWVRGTTNAFLEGLNSVFSAVKRKARGFRSTDNLITMLYFTAGKLDLPVTH